MPLAISPEFVEHHRVTPLWQELGPVSEDRRTVVGVAQAELSTLFHEPGMKGGFPSRLIFYRRNLKQISTPDNLILRLCFTFLNNELAFTPWEHDLNYNVVIRTCKFYIFVAKLFSNDFVGDFGWIFKLLQTNYRCGLQSSQTVGSALRTPWKNDWA